MVKIKAQAAMEYLMTYGWAILIVIIVVAALWSMGVFRTTSPVTCTPCFSYFAFVDYSNGVMKIKNGPQDIESVSISASPDTGSTVTITPNTTVSPGQTLTVTNIDTSGDISITITYTVSASGLNHTDTATIHNP